MLETLFRIGGTNTSAPATSVVLANLTLRHTKPTYMRKYAVPSGGDYAVYQSGAVLFNGTVNCSLQGSLLDAVGGNGVWLAAYNRGARIHGNEIRFPGENGIGLTGSTVWVDGTSPFFLRLEVLSGCRFSLV